MRDIDFKVLKFLVEGKAYSDTAVMKNFGEFVLKNFKNPTKPYTRDILKVYRLSCKNADSFNSRNPEDAGEKHSCW